MKKGRPKKEKHNRRYTVKWHFIEEFRAWVKALKNGGAGNAGPLQKKMKEYHEAKVNAYQNYRLMFAIQKTIELLALFTLRIE